MVSSLTQIMIAFTKQDLSIFCSHLGSITDLSSLKSTGRMMLLQYHANTEENADEWDGMSRRSSSPRLSSSNWSNKREVDSLHSTLCPKDEAQEEDSILPSVQKAHDGHHYSPSIIFLVHFYFYFYFLRVGVGEDVEYNATNVELLKL